MALFDQSMFDPQSYGGSGGLLGEILKMIQANPAQSQGFDASPQVGQTYAQGNQGSMGGVPFPIMGQPPQQDQAALPPNAQPTQAQQLPPQMQQQMPQQQDQGNQSPLGGGSVLGGLGDGLRSMLGVISPRIYNQNMQQSALQATYQSLRQSGVPDGVARAAALNPEVLKTIAPNLYSKPTFGITGQNQLGVNQYGFIDPVHQTVTPANQAGGATQAQAASPGIDPSLSGEEFLKAVTADPSLGPGKAAMVKSIAEGRTPYPSGFMLKTPFGQWLTTAVGQYEPGIDATLIGQRKTFNTQLGSATPTSIGGQKSLMGTALGHFAEVADAAVSLKNGAGPLPTWLPGSASAAHLVNGVTNSSTDQSAKVKALDDAVQKAAGEVGKLYSGDKGGGIQERNDTRSRFSGDLSPQEMAASLEMSKALIQSKLAALENQRDQIFGPDAKNKIDFLGDNGRAAIDKIDTAIAKLRGQGGAQPQQSTQTQQPAPKLNAGESTVINGIKIKRLN